MPAPIGETEKGWPVPSEFMKKRLPSSAAAIFLIVFSSAVVTDYFSSISCMC